jgi:glutathione synthase/RimK-type ligase-like ATP-grasp enzyme
MRTFILPYNPASESAKKLSEAIGAKRIKHEGSRYKHKPGDVIINWGCSEIVNPEVLKGRILNSPAQVTTASNKKFFFRDYPGNRGYLVPSTTAKEIADLWSLQDFTVVARHKLTGHSGEGIEIVEPGMLVPWAPLYTKYQKKTDEYRVHFVNGGMIKFARKGRKLDVPDEVVNWKVRNLEGGFIYALAEFEEMPESVLAACRDYAANTGLYFGAIDVIYHKPSNAAYILEVNTAPGLSGSTIEAYAEALKVG